MVDPKEAGIVKAAQGTKTPDVPSVDEIMEYVEAAIEELRKILWERGKQYGEETLVDLGEDGVAVMIRMKALRARYSIREEKPADSRRDSWLDMAGYALLAVSLGQYQDDSNA